MSTLHETSDLFGDGDEGDSIFDPIIPIKKEPKKTKSPQENSPFLKILDSETPSSCLNNEEKEDIEKSALSDSSEDLEKALVSEKARSETYVSLTKDLYDKLENAETELEQVRIDYAKSTEELASKMSQEVEWDSEKEALQAQLRISQNTIQKLKTENEQLGLKSEMQTDSPVDFSAVENERDAAVKEKEETSAKLQKLQNDLYLMRSEKVKQDDYILDITKQLKKKEESISQLKQQVESGAAEDSENLKEMSATIRKLEKEIARKDTKLSELEDLAVIARRSQRQEQDMKLQQEKIINLERKIDCLQRQDKTSAIREMENKPSVGDEPPTPMNEKPPEKIEIIPPKKSTPSPPLLPPSNTSTTSKLSESTSAVPQKEVNKTALIVDKQTGKSLRTATLEERIKKFCGSAENVNMDDVTATRHTFRRVSSSGSARSTPSPDNLIPRSSSEPVSPEPTKDEAHLAPLQSLPHTVTAQSKQRENLTVRKTYSPQPVRAKISVNPDICVTCGRTAYPIEKITVDKLPYHKFCFKCSICKSTLRPGRHASYEGIIYCLNHFKQEFLGGGGKYPGQVINYVP